MRIFIILLIFVILGTSLAWCSQDDPWQKLSDEAAILYRQRKYDQAIEIAKQALISAEKEYGPRHPNVAESLDNLAVYYQAKQQFQEAEEAYKRALSIIEERFGQNSEYLAIFMNYLADFYKKIGKYDQARELEKRAKIIRIKNRP